MTADQWINDKDDILLLLFCVLVFVVGVMIFIAWRSEKSEDYNTGGSVELENGETLFKDEYARYCNPRPNEALVFESEEERKIYHKGKVVGTLKNFLLDGDRVNYVYSNDMKLISVSAGILSLDYAQPLIDYIETLHQSKLTKLRFGIKGK